MNETITEHHYSTLREANRARQKIWDPEGKLSLLFRSNELAGETGEACNEVKKLERERLELRGSRTTKEKLAKELADVVICADLVAMGAGIDLDEAVVAKFNEKSDEVGIDVKLMPKSCQESPGFYGRMAARAQKRVKELEADLRAHGVDPEKESDDPTKQAITALARDWLTGAINQGEFMAGVRELEAKERMLLP